MKEREIKKLYNSISNIDSQYIEEAQANQNKKAPTWRKWGALAACLCLAAGALLWPKGPRIEIKEAASLDEITSSGSGNLLVERLVASGAKTTNVRLSYIRGEDASDPAAWDTLSITGDYNGQNFTLDCDYSSEGDRKDPAGAYAMTQYGDVEVTIYREESDGWGKPFLYQAEFTMDNITYNLSIHSDDPEDIYAYLDLILGEPEDSGNQSGATLTGVLGFDVCRVEMEESSSYQYRWHFYVQVDDKDICVAEQFGYDEPEAWSRDLDGDGVPELICNSTYGDGVTRVIVYRNNNGIIEEGSIRWSYYEERFGWNHLWEGGISSLPVEQYNPEKGVFTATDYYTHGYDNPVTVEFDDGLEPFDFHPFNHLP